MTALSANERLANAIWREIRNPARIYSKNQIKAILEANGIVRSHSTLFNNLEIRRLLEDKAEAIGLGVVIARACIFVTTEEWEILHRTVRQLRYLMTLAQSVGHEGRGTGILLASIDPVSREMGRQAIAAGVYGAGLQHAMDAAEAAIATTFEAGRAAANATFIRRRARAI